MIFLRWRKRKYFKKQVKNTYEKIWQHEFLRRRLQEEREGYRLEYDRQSEQLAAFQIRIEKLRDRNAEGDKDEITQCETKIQEILDYRKVLEDRMGLIDKQIQGSVQNGQEVQGINGAIDGYYSLIKMLEEERNNA